MLVNAGCTVQWILGVVYWPASSVAYRMVGTADEKVDELLFHLALLLKQRGLSLAAVAAELELRHIGRTATG